MIREDDSLRNISAEVCIYFHDENRKGKRNVKERATGGKLLGIKIKATVCKKKTTLWQCTELRKSVCEQEPGLSSITLSSRRAHK